MSNKIIIDKRILRAAAEKICNKYRKTCRISLMSSKRTERKSICCLKKKKMEVLRYFFPPHQSSDRPKFTNSVPEKETFPVTREKGLLKTRERTKIDKVQNRTRSHTYKDFFKDFSIMVAIVAMRILSSTVSYKSGKKVKSYLYLKSESFYRSKWLLEMLAKGTEALMERKPRNFAEEKGLLSEGQYGFRKHRPILRAINKILRMAENMRGSSIEVSNFLLQSS